MFAPQRSQAQMYSQVHSDTPVHSADPHRLVLLLLDGALESIAVAQGAMERGDIAAKGAAIGRAMAIIDEGLRAELDLQRGGQVAATLHDLYSCLIVRLVKANVHNDRQPLRECATLLSPLRDAWSQIVPAAAARRAVAPQRMAAAQA
jgi:flagellar secretion chaperone FliS